MSAHGFVALREVAERVLVLVVLAALSASFAAAAPAVTTIAPSSGNTAGGTPVTIGGTGFLPGASVRIGGVTCTQIKVVSATMIVAVSGANGAGVKRVTALNTASDSSGTNDLFTYGSTTDLTKTTKAHFEVAGASLTSLVTTGLDSTLRWINWSPTTGGSMAAGTYYYVVTAVNATGETPRSVESAAVTLSGGNNAARLSWTPISGALQYKLYRTLVSGTYVTPALIATVDTTGYVDGATLPSTGAPPTSNGATGDLFLSRGTTPATTYASGPATTAAVKNYGLTVARPNGTFLILHAEGTTGTSVYNPTAGTMTAGPTLTGNGGAGVTALKRPNGTFLIVHGDGAKTTSIYDPVANTMSAGPATNANVKEGAHAIRRPNGTFLVVCGDAHKNTEVYDPDANTMAIGPETTANAGGGAHSIPRPGGTFLIVLGNGSKNTSVYDPVANSMVAGPSTTDNVKDGGHAIQRPNGTFLILTGNNSNKTNLYLPIANVLSAGPATLQNIDDGAFSLQRADGKYLGFDGGAGKVTSFIYDPVANTFAAGTSLPAGIGFGAHALQIPDGRYLIVHGNNTTTTSLYDAGWARTGQYVSEKLNPTDINWWNIVSWTPDVDDTIRVFVRTATSSAALDGAVWRSVANGAAINPAPGEAWLQGRVDYARAISKYSGALEDVWGRGRVEFRRFATPSVASLTANYTPTTLSVLPSKSLFAYGVRETNTWVPADSSTLTNDGSVAETLLARISTFTDGTTNWNLSTISNGANQIRAQWSTTSAAGPWTDIAAYDANFRIADTVAVSGTVKLYFRIQTPTSTTYGVPFSSNLTVTAQ